MRLVVGRGSEIGNTLRFRLDNSSCAIYKGHGVVASLVVIRHIWQCTSRSTRRWIAKQPANLVAGDCLLGQQEVVSAIESVD